MTENSQLTAFLAEEARGMTAPAPAEPAPATQPAPEPAPATPAATDAPAVTTETAQPDDTATDPQHFRQLREVVESTKREREDWKSKAVRAETERDGLLKQLDEAKRAAPVPQPQYQPIDPAQDPAGFTQRLQGVVLNERLNTSEMLLRRELGAEKVDALIGEFQAAARADPALYTKLYAQPDPYGWAARQVETIRLQRDIGDDPAAYRARIETEARAKWEAEMATRGPSMPQGSSVPAMQPSLASARSVAARSAPQWSGEPSLDDVVASIRDRRKRA